MPHSQGQCQLFVRHNHFNALGVQLSNRRVQFPPPLLKLLGCFSFDSMNVHEDVRVAAARTVIVEEPYTLQPERLSFRLHQTGPVERRIRKADKGRFRPGLLTRLFATLSAKREQGRYSRPPWRVTRYLQARLTLSGIRA